MNEISHEQALSLLQSEADGLLDEAGLARQEWANLHAHLEACATCRAEERRLRTLQRELHTALRSGLDTHQPPPVSMQVLIDARAQRELLKKRLLRAVLMSGGLLLVVLLSVWLRPDQLLVALLDPWGTAADEFYGSFSGQIVYQSRDSSNVDLYLLQGGAQPRKLTQNLLDDTDPAWSPDGSWIAYLADGAADPLFVREIEPHDRLVADNMLFFTPTPRGAEIISPGKREVFVLAPGSNQPPLQVSAESGLAWLAPLSWSLDGKSIAAAGRILPAAIDNQAAYASDTWVYTLDLDGSGARLVAGTRGSTQARFAPSGRWLGFQQSRLGQHQFVFVRPEEPELDFRYLLNSEVRNSGSYYPGAAFAWSPGGSELAYLVEGPFVYRGTNYQPSNRAVTQLRRVIMSPSRMPVSLEEPVLVEMPYMDGLRDVSWSPDGTSLAMLQGLPDDTCWSVLVGRTPQVNGTPMEIYPVEGLCVVGHLTHRPWTPDGRWLVVSGRWNGRNAAIYALDVHQVIEHPNYAPLVARLTEPYGSDRMPQVQPAFPDLGLTPLAVQPRTLPALAEDLLAQAPGRLLINALSSSSPDGPAASNEIRGPGLSLDLLALAPGQADDPQLPFAASTVSARTGMANSQVWSPPDRQGQRRVAWVGIKYNASEVNGQHLYVAAVPPVEQVLDSRPAEPVDLTPDGIQFIYPPVWSPKGNFLAAVVTVLPMSKTGEQPGHPTQLAIFDGSGDPTQTISIIFDQVWFAGPLVWLADGVDGRQRIAALVSIQPEGQLRYSLAVAVIEIRGDGANEIGVHYKPVAGIEADQVRGLALLPGSPPGAERLAILTTDVEQGGLTYPRIIITPVGVDRALQVSRLEWFTDFGLAANQRPAFGDGTRGDRLRLRPGTQQLSLVINENIRSRVLLYPAAGGPAEVLLTWPEPIFQHAWSPDGAWLAVAGESGVWLVNVAVAQQGGLPFRLLSTGGWDIDWQ
jgi:Tol biopolymer transport system component